MNTQEYKDADYLKKYEDKVETHKLVPFKKIIELAEVKEGMRILDIGSGSGDLTYEMSSLGASLIGLDSSKQWVDKCIKRYKTDQNLSFIQGNATNLPFKDSSFELVIMNMVLLNVEKEQDVEKIINEISRVLKKGGRLIFSDLHPVCIMTTKYKNRFQEYSKNFSYFKNGDRYTVGVKLDSKNKISFKNRHWTLEFYTKLLAKSGLYISRISEPTYDNKAPLKLRNYKIPEYILFLCNKLN